MRKIILGVAVSLDGFIEGPNGEYDWCFTDQDYGMTDFLKGIDAMFYGRKSYEMMMHYEAPGGENPWKGMKSYVFSNTLKKEGKDFELVSGDIEKKVKEIKNMKGKDIWLFGGASLTSSLLNAGLVDELGMAVHPILLGQGKPLFSGIQKRIKTKLISSKEYSTGLVYLSYEVLGS
jgi:dihydrofolate reductase